MKSKKISKYLYLFILALNSNRLQLRFPSVKGKRTLEPGDCQEGRSRGGNGEAGVGTRIRKAFFRGLFLFEEMV